MTPSPIAAVRALPRFAYLSPAEAREVVLAVLGAVREPSKAMVQSAGGAYVNLERADDPSYEPPGVWRDMLDALVAEVQESA